MDKKRWEWEKGEDEMGLKGHDRVGPPTNTGIADQRL